MKLNNTPSPYVLAGACGQTVLQRAINESKMFDSYITECKKLTNEYVVPCSVFTFNGVNLIEAVKGYFVAESNIKEEVDSLKECLMTTKNPAILIKEYHGKQTYQVGTIYESLMSLPSDVILSQVFSIKSKSYFDR